MSSNVIAYRFTKACSEGDFLVVKSYIDNGMIDVNSTDLRIAIKHNHLDIVKYIIHNTTTPLSLKLIDPSPSTTLCVLINGNHLEMLQFILKQTSPDAKSTCLHLSITFKQINMFKYFIEDVQFDPERIYQTIINTESAEIFEYMIKNKRDLLPVTKIVQLVCTSTADNSDILRILFELIPIKELNLTLEIHHELICNTIKAGNVKLLEVLANDDMYTAHAKYYYRLSIEYNQPTIKKLLSSRAIIHLSHKTAIHLPHKAKPEIIRKLLDNCYYDMIILLINTGEFNYKTILMHMDNIINTCSIGIYTAMMEKYPDFSGDIYQFKTKIYDAIIKKSSIQGVRFAIDVFGDNEDLFRRMILSNFPPGIFKSIKLDAELQDELIMLSCTNGRTDCFRVLAEINVSTTWHHRTFINACFNSNVSIVQHMLDKYPTLWASMDAAMMFAIDAGNIKIVNELINRGYDISKNNNIALKQACEYGHTKLVAELIESGADVNAMSAHQKVKYGYNDSLYFPNKLPDNTNCIIGYQPISIGQTYVQCTSTVPHQIMMGYYKKLLNTKCPYCTHELDPKGYVNC
jgi:ankyrin repeat protein